MTETPDRRTGLLGPQRWPTPRPTGSCWPRAWPTPPTTPPCSTELRDHLAGVSRAARPDAGLWPVANGHPGRLATASPPDTLDETEIWPKLFRRLVPFGARLPGLRPVRHVAARRPGAPRRRAVADREAGTSATCTTWSPGERAHDRAHGLARGLRHRPRPGDRPHQPARRAHGGRPRSWPRCRTRWARTRATRRSPC